MLLYEAPPEFCWHSRRKVRRAKETVEKPVWLKAPIKCIRMDAKRSKEPIMGIYVLDSAHEVTGSRTADVESSPGVVESSEKSLGDGRRAIPKAGRRRVVS